jgi:hypothetical protein
MRIDDWATFLRTWSAERMAVSDASDESVRNGWLGFEPATEDEITAAEGRLGTSLPPSYRDFLAVTNGWRWAGEFVTRLCTTEDVALFRDMSDFVCQMLDEFEQEDLDEDPEDEEVHAAKKWSRAVQVSLEGDLTYFVLDPGDVNAEGEWAAYRYASWSDGPQRYESFADLMYAMFQEFHSLRKPENATTRGIDARIEQARADLLAGKLDRAVAILEDAKQFGRAQAGLYLFQTRVLLGRTYMLPKVRTLLADNDPFLEHGVLPVLAWLAEREAHGHGDSDAAVDAYRRRIQDGTFRALDGEAARRARELAMWGDPEGAWRVLATEALPDWLPSSDRHVAPVELLADPLLGPLITPERARQLLTTPRPGTALTLPPYEPPQDGITWLPDSRRPGRTFCVTFTRTMDARGLARSLGADEGSVMPPPITAKAQMALFRETERGIVRVGTCGNGWSFAIENNTDRVDAGEDPIPGVTVWRQGPSSPVRFAYVDDESRTVCTLAEGGLKRGGTQPGLLDAALPASEAPGADRAFTDLQILKAVEQHFGLTLPRRLVEHERLPVLYAPRRPRPKPSGLTLTVEMRPYR